MKVSIALFAVLFVSAVSAAPVKDQSIIAQAIINLVEGVIQQLEKGISGWDAEDSLEKNVLALVDKPISSGFIPGWKSEASIEDNLVDALENYIKSFDLPGFDESKTVTENVDVIVASFLNKLPIPAFFPIDQIKSVIAENIKQGLKNIDVAGFDVEKSVDDDIVAWVEASLAGIEGVDPDSSLEEYVNDAVKNALAQITIPGFSSSKTLEDNVAEVIANLLVDLPF